MNALLNITEVARLLNLNVWTVRKLVSKKALPVVRIGRRTLVEPAALERWVRQHRGGAQ